MKLSEAAKMLTEAGIPDAKREARLMFREIGGVDDASLYLTDCRSDLDELDEAVRRRCKREPLQYIIGKVAFYNEEYRVTPDCLIPRSDTEILIEFAAKSIPAGKKFLDLCTGSGCVAISTLAHTDRTCAVAVDLYEKTLSVAKENAKLNGVEDRIEFIASDALERAVDGEFFAILSNPPYVTEKAYGELEKEIYYEPKAALLAGEDGLIFYKRLTALYKNSFEDGGFIAFEIGYDQGDALRKIAKEAGLLCEIIKDYSQNDRVAVLKMG